MGLDIPSPFVLEVGKVIVDKLSNIGIYSEIPSCVKTFIQSITPDIDFGRYELENNSYVNIEAYTTKMLSEAKFEAHKKYADIQILLSGIEKIYIKPADTLICPLEYNEDKDIRFFNDDIKSSDYVTLDGSNFVFIYPHEAHAPQIAFDDTPQQVKKAVVKLFL